MSETLSVPYIYSSEPFVLRPSEYVTVFDIDTFNNPEIQEVSPDTGIKRYNRIWLRKMSNATGFIISDDDKKVDGILDALNRKDGHCPCGGNGPQFLCPCVIMREQGICKCGLYENVTPIKPSGGSSARIKEGNNE